uniref:Wobble nucleotide-excising tRNase n=1 Tax=Candidatus Kentrum sp. MB TaxID=2138164 RepID=A0A450XVN1_9GAMM|nr:MAG: Wobble nucleotide-excising tRNase [Candidatus Kentron sp. MB]VFK76122.1 MAG: Wobble nucleotide-excising tRNase [Candidatus Kentron sp. MB]
MITSISIKNVATYDANGVYLEDLQRINFIYGANGTGKTVLSNLLANGADPLFSHCEVSWQQDRALQTLVYNKRFRERHFGKGSIEGVFTLGEDTRENMALIREREGKLAEIMKAGTQTREVLDKLEEQRKTEENSFKEEAWRRVYKRYEEDFKEAFKGVAQKEKLKKRLLDGFGENTEPDSFDELKGRAETIFGEPPRSISSLEPVSVDGLEMMEAIEADACWSGKIIGKSDVDIAGLIQRLEMNDWVNQGRALLQEDATCPFCQQPTITEDFRRKLGDYFDESFTRAIGNVRRLGDEYGELADDLLDELTQKEADERRNQETKLDIERFSSQVKILAEQLAANKERISNKQKEPSRVIEMTSTRESLRRINDLIGMANEEIKKHNVIVENYGLEKQRLIAAIWRYLVEEYREEMERYHERMKALQIDIGACEKEREEKRREYRVIKGEIEKLNSSITSVQPTIDKMNRTLRQFGFLNFEIVPSPAIPNHYQLQRENRELAEESLSEGEVTFVTFLYFMHLAKGSTNKAEMPGEKVLVVDDPISSLDSMILSVVSTLLKDVINELRKNQGNEGNIRQLILLTHNVSFHKEVSFTTSGKRKDGAYWVLRKNGKISTIESFKEKNPIRTSYELLWRELRNKDRNSSVTIQNTMRRIIENYFKILGKYENDDELVAKFPNKEEQEICRSLLSWINDGSHHIPDDLFIESREDITDRYFKVFEDIFKHTNQEGHYRMMMDSDGE